MGFDWFPIVVKQFTSIKTLWIIGDPETLQINYRGEN